MTGLHELPQKGFSTLLEPLILEPKRYNFALTSMRSSEVLNRLLSANANFLQGSILTPICVFNCGWYLVTKGRLILSLAISTDCPEAN